LALNDFNSLFVGYFVSYQQFLLGAH